MRLKERERGEVYDRLVRLADKILAKYQPCGKCPVGCPTQRLSKAWCCGGCPKLGPQGCTVQALACKLWVCRNNMILIKPRGKDRECFARLDRLTRIARHYEIYVGRASKEESLHYGAQGLWWCPGTGGGSI